MGRVEQLIEICVTTYSGVNYLPQPLSVTIHLDYNIGGVVENLFAEYTALSSLFFCSSFIKFAPVQRIWMCELFNQQYHQ